MMLLVAVGGISWEALRRVVHPDSLPGPAMIWVAAVGIGINSFTALLFFRGRHDDVNVRGAFLHLAADAAVSLGVVIAGVVVVRTGLRWIDPVMSLLIAAVILASTWALLRESLDLALDAVPKSIDPQSVFNYLASVDGVASVHDLHIWGLSTTEAALTAHLIVPSGEADDARLAEITRQLHDRFGIEHATVQIERGTDGVCPSGASCDGAPLGNGHSDAR
jgi:cobalt-zinc-cadmium efflux system protein